MRQITTLCLLLFALFSSVLAQSTQNGIVLEYHGPNKKTPLANVEVIVQNAGSVVSGPDGKFTLNFRTLKPGDKITVRRVEKIGYELFNTDAVSQFIITSDKEPITIVMCSSETIREIRNNYKSLSEKRFKVAYSNESKSLINKYRAGYITQEEFDKKLREVQNHYDEMLEQIDTYIDRFARLDLSELSSLDRKVIDLVREGNILDAIKQYEDANLLEHYVKQSQEIDKLIEAEKHIASASNNQSKSIQNIRKSINNQINILSLAGGTENFQKAGKLMKDMADSSPKDFDLQMEYADYCLTNNHIDESLKYYDIAFDDAGNDILKKALVRIKRGEVYSRMKDIDLGTYESVIGLHDIDSILEVKNDTYQYLQDRAYAQRTIAANFIQKKDYSNAQAYYSWALEEMYQMVLLDSVKYVNEYVETMVEYGKSLLLTNDSVMAENTLTKAINILNSLYEASPRANAGLLAKAYDELGELYLDQYKTDNAENCFWKSLEYYTAACEFNSDRYLGLSGECLQKLGRLHLHQRRYDRALTVFNKSIELFNQASVLNPYEYKEQIANSNLYIGTVYWMTEDYPNTLKQNLLAEQQYTELYEKSHDLYSEEIGRCAIYSGDCYFKLGDLKNALACYQRACKYIDSVEYNYKRIRLERYLKTMN